LNKLPGAEGIWKTRIALGPVNIGVKQAGTVALGPIKPESCCNSNFPAFFLELCHGSAWTTGE
jgi:hypothetical protein